jgi:hypothetical protein
MDKDLIERHRLAIEKIRAALFRGLTPEELGVIASSEEILEPTVPRNVEAPVTYGGLKYELARHPGCHIQIKHFGGKIFDIYSTRNVQGRIHTGFVRTVELNEIQAVAKSFIEATD